ncbi:erythroferrone isoform X2 [Hippocampus comes]|uniref:erythroferrone isoform X2 n=1 Tax=Hippocampus comes TaxID=109280 RepID=UPI00094EAF09|nr:PREDICTED: erythroferrone-like isoform X2 [Hippocampus comes]
MMMKSRGESEPFHLSSHGASGPNMKRWPFPVGCRTMMMTITMVTMIVSSSQEDAVLKDDQVVQDWPPLGNSPVPPPLPPSPPSPRTSWLMFINNSDMRKSSRKLDKRPPRPRGPSAPRLHSKQLIDDLHGPLTGVSSKVFCELCKCPPRISASFFGRLPQVVRVARRSLMELHPFSQAPPSVCAFQRGRSVNNTHGRYTATITGFYLLSARLRLKSSERVQVRLHESVKAAICVESLCHTKLSIESVVGVASVGADFSITLTGTLFLQAGEYASVYVDNATGANISVLPESFFSTILLGS